MADCVLTDSMSFVGPYGLAAIYRVSLLGPTGLDGEFPVHLALVYMYHVRMPGLEPDSFCLEDRRANPLHLIHFTVPGGGGSDPGPGGPPWSKPGPLYTTRFRNIPAPSARDFPFGSLRMKASGVALRGSRTTGIGN